MDFDFTPYFEKYETLVKAVDTVFEQVQEKHPDCVKCEVECADCCHAVFDLTLIEALYINHKFNEKYQDKPEERSALIEEANKADRQAYKIKRQAFKDKEAGKSEDEIVRDLAKVRLRCPLLNTLERCDMYEYRPITCRLYGIPTAIGGQGHTCGKSGFREGEQYPTVNMDLIHQQLVSISQELIQEIGSKHVRMSDMLVPLSMSLITVYDDEYLGVADPEKTDAATEPEDKEK